MYVLVIHTSCFSSLFRLFDCKVNISSFYIFFLFCFFEDLDKSLHAVLKKKLVSSRKYYFSNFLFFLILLFIQREFISFVNRFVNYIKHAIDRISYNDSPVVFQANRPFNGEDNGLFTGGSFNSPLMAKLNHPKHVIALYCLITNNF